MVFVHVFQYELYVDEVELQTDSSDECEEGKEPLGCIAEGLTEQDHSRNAARDIYHAFEEQRELSAPVVLKLDAHHEREDEQQ